MPILKCNQASNDLFTVSESSKGNHKLTYPIGLITIDEVVLAGAFGGANNRSFYLYTNQDYWTMSPSYINSSGTALMFTLNSDGIFDSGYSAYWSAPGVRPVINLRSDVRIEGEGTSTDPYQVVGA